MKTSLNDLNQYLFEALDRLSNDDLEGDALANEINRAAAVCGVGRMIVDNASLCLKAAELQAEYGGKTSILPPMLDHQGHGD